MPKHYLLISAIFVTYFILHSTMASLWFKQRLASHFPAITPYYRLIYNTLAVLLALPLAYLAWRYPGQMLWQWEGIAFYLVNVIALLAFIALIYSLHLYDMSEFLGLRQAKNHVHQVKDMEVLHISVFHRYVRHPWYSLILVILWTRDITTTQLLIYSLVTLYLIIGSRLEENKLIAYHGDVYKAYRKKVAGLIPVPWKILSKQEAENLLETYYARSNKDES